MIMMPKLSENQDRSMRNACVRASTASDIVKGIKKPPLRLCSANYKRSVSLLYYRTSLALNGAQRRLKQLHIPCTYTTIFLAKGPRGGSVNIQAFYFLGGAPQTPYLCLADGISCAQAVGCRVRHSRFRFAALAGRGAQAPHCFFRLALRHSLLFRCTPVP